MSVVSLLSQPNYLSHLIGISQITPYAQQAALLRRTFGDALGAEYERLVEVNTVDAFQGREANIGKRSLLFIVYANEHRVLTNPLVQSSSLVYEPQEVKELDS